MRKQYPSDISREVFEKEVWPVLSKARKKTKPIVVDVYEVFCGVLYALKSGCQWRMLPSDFPHWRTCHDYFQKWGGLDESGQSLLQEALKKCGRRSSTRPWAGCANDYADRRRAEREEYRHGREQRV